MKAGNMRMIKRLVYMLFAVSVISICIYDIPCSFAVDRGASAGTPAGAPGSEPGELIVVYEESEGLTADEAAELTEETVAGLADAGDVEPVSDSVGDDGAAVLVKLDDEQDKEQAEKILEKQDEVAYVQPNFRYRMMDTVQTDDTYREDLYHLEEWDDTFSRQCGADVTGAWKVMGGIRDPESSQEPVKIAVLDSGCQVTHEDLRDAVDMEHAYDAVTQSVGAEYVADQSGHGTHVCGIAAGVADNGKGIAGAAGNYAEIIPVNVFTGQWARTTDMISAFTYLEELMDSGEVSQLHVINMSLGGYGETDESDDILHSYIERMREKDVLTVCAGGNGDEQYGLAYKDNPVFPGDFEACMCVTSLDSDGTNSIFSDYNMDKDISAPGSFILSTMTDATGTAGDGEDAKYGYLSGTSMASPLVAGIAALIWADNPDLTADEVFESIIETAVPVNPAVNSHVGETGSAGAIDAGKAVAYAREHFDETRERLQDGDASLDTASFVYDGTEKKPEVTVTCGGKTLEEDKDYLVSYNNNVDAGKAAAAVTGIRHYIGTVILEFDIGKADISNAEIIADPVEFEYDGRYHFPSNFNVIMNGQKLKWGRDYTVNALTDGIEAGIHRVEVAGKGNYTGTEEATYTIKSKEEPGPDPESEIQKEIAAAKKLKVSGLTVKCKGRKFTVTWKKNGKASGYQVYYKLKTAKKWTRLKATTGLKAVSKKLKKGNYYQFRVRTYKNINGSQYCGKWTSVKTVKCK